MPDHPASHDTATRGRQHDLRPPHRRSSRLPGLTKNTLAYGRFWHISDVSGCPLCDRCRVHSGHCAAEVRPASLRRAKSPNRRRAAITQASSCRCIARPRPTGRRPIFRSRAKASILPTSVFAARSRWRRPADGLSDSGKRWIRKTINIFAKDSSAISV
jgi:hypothetical protein